METVPNQRPRLIPVQVPWQICASAAYLRAEFAEIQSHHPIRADFIGFFRCNETGPAGHFGTSVEIVKPPPPFQEAGDGSRGKYQRVRVLFDHGLWLRCSPGFSESQVIETAAYDWSDIPAALRPGETASENVLRVRASWLSTGIALDPRMYEILPSFWIEELGLRNPGGRWHHYLLTGSDGYIEVIARGWQWIPGQVVPG
jgi:hypothetical protein